MLDTNSVVAIYQTHAQAEEAVKELQKSGFDMKKMSIVGKDYHTDEHVVGCYNLNPAHSTPTRVHRSPC
jgi:predicted nucleic acid-binding protein